MIKKICNLILMAVIVSFTASFTACSDDDTDNNIIENGNDDNENSGDDDENGNNETKPIAAGAVFVLGKMFPGDNGEGGACFWKNSALQKLPSNNTREYCTKSIFVSGNDVYIVGEEQNGNYYNLILWKNGSVVKTIMNIEKGSSNEVFLFVSGNDIYTAGKENIGQIEEYIYVQKNDKEYFKIEKRGKYQSLLRNIWSLFVSGNDVYVMIDTDLEDGIGNTNILYKNGEPLYYYGYSGGEELTSVFVSGNDVYVAGKGGSNYTNFSPPVYWKNNEQHVLPGNGMVTSIFVSGNDVYLSGYNSPGNYNVATYWKNGVANILSTDGTATSVFVSGDDVYVAGYERVAYGYSAILWKNGAREVLSPGMEAHSVFVKE